jgi:hypothetical protein
MLGSWPARTGSATACMVAALALAACAGGSSDTAAVVIPGETPDPDTPVSGGPASTASPSPLPSAPSGPADLTIRVDDGQGSVTTWRLSCDPAGGDHPHPDAACGVLGAHGRAAFRRPDPAQVCTEIYGGPQVARITGTWRDERVRVSLNRTNGCQIARWDALRGLLPDPSG